MPDGPRIVTEFEAHWFLRVEAVDADRGDSDKKPFGFRNRLRHFDELEVVRTAKAKGGTRDFETTRAHFDPMQLRGFPLFRGVRRVMGAGDARAVQTPVVPQRHLG